jgi:hypothetical protein
MAASASGGFTYLSQVEQGFSKNAEMIWRRAETQADNALVPIYPNADLDTLKVCIYLALILTAKNVIHSITKNYSRV